MSFYQPSLSLFDVLNALSDQTRLRDPQQRVNHRHPHGHGGHMHGPYSSARPNASFDPFGGYYSGAPAGYYYRDPQDNYYYSPQYDEDEDDEEEDFNDEDENGDQKMSGTDEGDETPSYYHSKGTNNDDTDYEKNRRDYLNKLFQAFTGSEPRYADEPDSEDDGKPKEVVSKPETKAKSETKPEAETEKQEPPKPAPVASEKIAKETEKPIKAPTPEREGVLKPKLKKRVSSHAHLNAPSPIPDPLQISKPETRLDLPFSPEVNVYDLKDQYVVVLALPGASSKAFKVDYHPSSHELLVKGNVIDRLGIDEKFLKITEIKYGAFERTVKFPVLPRIKDDEIKAKYSNGLLQIRVPKMEGPKEKPVPKKRITIEDIPDAELEFEKNPNPVEKI